MNPAETILNIRLSENMEQSTLAKRVGISQSLISKIERGMISPDINTFIKILKVFGMKMEIKEKK